MPPCPQPATGFFVFCFLFLMFEWSMDGYCDDLHGNLTGWDLEPKGGPPLLPVLSELETHQGPFISLTQAEAQRSLPRCWSLRGQTNKRERVKRPWPNHTLNECRVLHPWHYNQLWNPSQEGWVEMQRSRGRMCSGAPGGSPIFINKEGREGLSLPHYRSF